MTKSTKTTALSRRQLLGRIGLTAGAAYMAPALVGLNAARASGASGGGSGASGNSGASRSSGPSRNSGPSRGRGSQGRAGRASAAEAPRWVQRMLGL